MMITPQKFSFCIWQSFAIKLFLTISSTLVTQQALSQFTDDFRDGDFSNAPTWSGNETRFVVSDSRLRLQAPPQTGSSYLSTPSQAINTAIWEFFVKMEFNPSGGNLAKVYLTSDHNDLSGEVNGYFVQIGDTPDDISLYKQSGSVTEKIIDGENGRVNLSLVDLRVKVTRDLLGNWQLFSDVGVTGTYASEGTCFDDTHASSSAFGVLCLYTPTRSTLFYFDDFIVTGNAFVDLTPPELSDVKVTTRNRLELTFSESMDRASAENINNYIVSPETGIPATAILETDRKKVSLTFLTYFLNGTSQRISVSGLKDLAGNNILPAEKRFTFFEPVQSAWKDVLITEIFPDPSPAIGLPEGEFVELFNRSSNPIDLNNWSLTDGGSSSVLSALLLLPGEYLTVHASTSDYSSFGKSIAVPDFPSLNNSADVLTLKDADGILIDSVNYNDGWYRDQEKKEGGWTLELIDPENSCGESENWIASDHSLGGTPGQQNSVFAIKPDLTGPELTAAVPLSSTLVLLSFDEKLENVLPEKTDIELSADLAVESITFANPSLRSLLVSLSKPLESGITYTIRVRRIYDCAGNEISDHHEDSFGLPELADSLDVVINEILFNPRPTGVDFLELYNRSSKYFNLKGWSVANVENGVLKNRKVITTEDILLRPGAYLVLTEHPDILKGEYPTAIEGNFRKTEMPSMNDDEGSIAVSDGRGKQIDWFQYSDDLHSLFIKNDEGVSLERISINGLTNDAVNWRSASSQIGFATPGYLNSNARADLLAQESIHVIPEVFDPLSGQPDFVQIAYKFNQGGNVANVKIIDPQGRTVKELANNELLGTEGFLRWDGDTQEGTKARIGYYMIWFQVFDASGKVDLLKRRVAIAGQF